MNTQIIKEQAAIIRAIDSIKVRGKKLDSDLHILAMSTVAHYAEHGDYTLVNRLLCSLPKSARQQSLITWITGFSTLALNPKRAERKEFWVVHPQGAKARFDMDKADETPFWEYTKEASAYRQFDLNEAIEALLKRAETALANANQDTSKVQPDRLAALRAIAHPVANDATVEEQAA